MARDVNWWLMSGSALLGLLLTLALTIRKVTRQVPVSRTVEVPKPHVDKAVAHVEHKVDEAVAHVEHKNTAAFEHAEHVLEHQPHVSTTAATVVTEGDDADAHAVITEGAHLSSDIVVTEGAHLAADTVITEHHSPAADSSLVIIDDGIPEAESRIRIIGAD